jgi:tetratricopeptide (TPR) repeat protein
MSRRLHLSLLSLLVPLGLVLLGAAEPVSTEGRFHEGAAAYRAGDYAEAEAAWREVLAAGAVDGHVLYDLGNALYRQGQLGSAILAWRQAQVMLPREPDARANLEHAREQVQDELAPAGHVPPVLFWQRSLALGESALLGSLLLGFGLGAFSWLRWRRRRQVRELGSLRPAAWLAVVLGSLMSLSTGLTAQALHSRPAP